MKKETRILKDAMHKLIDIFLATTKTTAQAIMLLFKPVLKRFVRKESKIYLGN